MTEERSISLSAVKPGDLVFLNSDGGTLGEMIRRYDGSPFSHVGVAMGGGLMASCRTSTVDYSPDADLGGVRDDPIERFRDRNPHVGRPVGGTDVAAALERIGAWRESGSQNRSHFSFVKLFMVAAGLNAVRVDQSPEASRAMLGAALRAACEWTVEPGEDDPGFFCAEMVAQAFGRGFTVGQFRPPVAVPEPAGTEGFRDWAALARRLRNELPDGPESRAALRLVLAVRRHDPEFLCEAMEQLVLLLGDRLRPPAEPTAVEAAIGDGDPLPTPLVTPRMLRCADWVDWHGPIVFPT